MSHADEGKACPQGDPECRLQALFREVNEMIRATFSSVTLDTLVR